MRVARLVSFGDTQQHRYITVDDVFRDTTSPDHHVDPDPETDFVCWTNEAPKRLRGDLRTYFLGRPEHG